MNYFLSDTHFGHDRIILFERKQFKNILEHDKFIINKLKKTLKKDDVLYHLGDFGCLNSKLQEEWKSIKGKKILIRGNHDKQLNKLKFLFDEVYNHPIWFNKRVLLSHEPLPVTDGSINLHGHLHNAHLFLSNYYNMNIHLLNYELFSEKQVRKIILALEKDNFNFLYEWYAKYYNIIGDNERIVYNEDGTINLKETRKNYK